MGNLIVDFELNSIAQCGGYVFEDTTQYGSGSGSGELPSYADIGSTTIVFDLRNGETVTINSFIPTEETPEFTIYAGDLGYDDIIPDQVCTITYTVYDQSGNVLGTASQPELLACNYTTCFATRVRTAAPDQCCTLKNLMDLAMMDIRFTGIQATVEVNAGCACDAIEDLSFECAKQCFNGCQ